MTDCGEYRQAAGTSGPLLAKHASPMLLAHFVGKLDKCGRDVCYGLAKLVNKRGRDAKVIDWLDEITADCPKKTAHNAGARCPDLPRVL